MEYTLIFITILGFICSYVAYVVGRDDGRHIEHSYLLGILESIKMEGLSPETRYSVLMVTKSILTKLKEGRK